MKPTMIQSPVRGDWSFMNPPGHHPDAKDFVAVNEAGMPYERTKILRHLFYKLSVTDTYAWEKEIFSPFEGEVIGVKNNAQDRMDLNIFRDLVSGLVLSPRNRKNDIDYFLGNYVVLESKTGFFALVAHLRQGSVVVNKGMKVVAGELIAKVGNSGNTIQPHLHFQVMKKNDLCQSTPIPFIFRFSQIGNNGAWDPVNSTLPRNWQKFRV